MDIFFIVLILVFFLGSWSFVRLCAALEEKK